MSEHSDENEELSVPPQADSDVVSLIKKMQQQLNYLEKKIDILIGGGQSSERPAFRDREKRFSKPFRPSFGGGSGGRDFNRGPRREGFSHDRPRPGGFSSDRPRSSGFSKDRPPREGGFSSDRPRERSSGSERSFDRKPGAGSRGFGHGDKPFFRHRKGPR
jgi:ATP-dependent RNA helicase DeaD